MAGFFVCLVFMTIRSQAGFGHLRVILTFSGSAVARSQPFLPDQFGGFGLLFDCFDGSLRPRASTPP